MTVSLTSSSAHLAVTAGKCKGFSLETSLNLLSQVLTGSYHNYFRIYDVNGDNDIVLQADKSAFKAKKIGGARGKAPGKKEGLQTEGIDFAKKIVCLFWIPV